MGALSKTIKGLERENDTLRADNAQLRGEVEALEAKNDSLRADLNAAKARPAKSTGRASS